FLFMKKAIFLDRDGTINIDYGYVSKPGDFHLLKSAGQTLKILQDKGYLLIIITNQSGIGRKYYSLDDFYTVNSIMIRKLQKHGVKITDIFFCPHNPDARCSCRKPSPEMVFKAAKKWNIDLSHSFFIGDKTSDILCGKNSGCITIQIINSTPFKASLPETVIEQADYRINDLCECLSIIERVETLQKKKIATAVIPARLRSTRIPYKLLKIINGTYLLRYTYNNLLSMNIFKDIVVATDSLKIRSAARRFGARVFMTSSKHQSGTSRICEIHSKIKTPIILNVQGDEPLLSISHIDKLLFYLSQKNAACVATAITPIKLKEHILSPSVVKVVKDNDDFALYFSRSPVPFVRDKGRRTVFFKHLGIYGYRKEFFSLYKRFQTSELEVWEKLEQLTFLASGVKIKLLQTQNDTLGIDTLQELKEFQKIVSLYPAYFRNLFSLKNNYD
ncbi:MAG: 3-deoxy-manno-octulosonate cytidylyltransferase, partial [Candidatus Aureabacteria bacterium]|nr:3-deoxy-manno-octulosonate cytidylyltransferase [Candidatus Auribacterota bacterium]